MEPTGRKSSGFHITTFKDKKVVVLCFRDMALNFYVSKSLKEILEEALRQKLEEGYRHFVLDMSEVKVMDSTGLGLTIVAHNVVSARNAKLCICSVRKFIRQIFTVCRVDKHLRFFDDQEEALAAIASEGG